MAMLPFCGYNFGDYWAHWLDIGARLKNPPRLFHVNWFRRNPQGKFLWPGFGDNLRVIEWMLKRSAGTVPAKETAIGHLPRPEDLNTSGLNLDSADLQELLTVDPALWRKELRDIGDYLQKFGSRTPRKLHDEHKKTLHALES